MKSVIVTGASSGIGQSAVVHLTSAGYRVFGLARSLEKMNLMSADLHNFVPIEFDITRPEKFDDIVGDILSISNSEIYGLVNNAGYVEPGAIEDITMDNMRLQFETNFFGLVGFTKKILPLMIKRNEGRIVNISSMAGMVSLPLIGVYCATKHALEAVSDALRMELWDTNIHVINVNPGVIETNIHGRTIRGLSQIRGSRFAEAYEKYLGSEPKGLPAEIVARVIVEALSMPRPKTRYLVGSGKEKSAIRMRHLIPDGIFYSQVSKRIVK